MVVTLNRAITLQALGPEHAEALFTLVDTNREHLRAWLPWVDRTRRLADTQAYIRSTMTQAGRGLGPTFAVFCDGQLAGVNGFHPLLLEHRWGGIGYWLGAAFSGRGAAITSTRYLLDIGFHEFNLNRIEIRCAVGNSRSARIPQQLGFALEGRLRQCEWLYDHFVDHEVYGLLRAEYRAR